MRAVRSLPCLDFLCFPLAVQEEREKKETYNVYSEEKSIVYIKFITFTDEKVSTSPYSTQHPVTTLKAAKLL